MFRETFDFDAPCPDYDKCNPQLNTDLYGINQVKGALRQRHPEISFKASALGNELKRICGKYTNTVGKTIKLEHKGYIEDGVVKSGQWKKYVLPPLARTDAFD